MKIATLIGPVCSGKTYRLNKEEYQDAYKIDVGDIVRTIKKQQGRIFDMTLDQQIITRLESWIEDSVLHRKDLVIAGIRQLSILKSVETYIKALKRVPINEISEYQRIYLNTDPELRRRRFDRRQEQKDTNLSFEEVEESDKQLGFEELTNYCLKEDRINTQIYNL